MNLDRRAAQIEKAALREAQRTLCREDKTALSRDELLQLRVQLVPLWRRAFFFGLGAVVVFLGIQQYFGEPDLPALIVLGMIGVGLMIFGVMGRRKTLETAFEEIGSKLAEAVIEGIFRTLH